MVLTAVSHPIIYLSMATVLVRCDIPLSIASVICWKARRTAFFNSSMVSYNSCATMLLMKPHSPFSQIMKSGLRGGQSRGADDSVPNAIIRTIYELYNHNIIKITIGSGHTEWRPINCGVRQGFLLSPLLFNIYINSIIRYWRLTIHGNIPLFRNCTLDTLLYADDQVLFTNEDELQYSIYHLNIIAQNFNMKISPNKTKIMAFQGKQQVRSKIYIGTHTLEQGGHVTPKSGSPPRPNSGGWNPQGPPPREQIPDFPPVQPLHPDDDDSGDSSDPESVKRQKL
ncbi:hypothetical protein ANN_25339 [Periplaneta americana]|uniref:Reverse transcriptase domain-containing protein n=1 Tax=Periplaneta americana TaxID=6978 RepID=A0ABQ8S1B0_PERAM|nr:hypothetical protein ANN_25339 [Periplaneta americana]